MCTQDGIAFLKCALAAPDFGVDPGKGIPDRYTGRVVPIKDRNTVSVNFTKNKQTYILVLPIPGYMYFMGEAAIGSVPTTFTGVTMSTYDSNFGDVGGKGQGNFSKFRFASLSAELQSTSNEFQWGGSVKVWRIDVSFQDSLIQVVKDVTQTPSKYDLASGSEPVVAITNTTGTQVYEFEDITSTNRAVVGAPTGTTSVGGFLPTGTHNTEVLTDGHYSDANVVSRNIQGMSSVTATAPRDCYVRPFPKGAYAVSTNVDSTFEWTGFTRADAYVANDANLTLVSASGKPLTGLGNMHGLLFTVDTPNGDQTSNSGTFTVWSCMECLPNTNSTLYQMATNSPAYDPVALNIYSKYAQEHPIAVPYTQNDSAWKTFLTWTVNIGHTVGLAGGPIGFAGNLVANAARALQSLTI